VSTARAAPVPDPLQPDRRFAGRDCRALRDDAVVIGGDWNEDEVANGATRGPVAGWRARRSSAAPTERIATDRRRRRIAAVTTSRAATRATARGNKSTTCVAGQHRAAAARDDLHLGLDAGRGAAARMHRVRRRGSGVTNAASDHRPVFADLRLPVVDCNGNGVADTTDIANGTATDANGNQSRIVRVLRDQFLPDLAQLGRRGRDHRQLRQLEHRHEQLPAPAYDAPPNASALFFYGPETRRSRRSATGSAASAGRCRASDRPPRRVRRRDVLLDFTSGSAAQITPGSTWSFQLWYRNPAAAARAST
jgi:hypothetical protein